MRCLGIDPGLSGAVVLIEGPARPTIIHAQNIPTRGEGTRRRVDGRELMDVITAFEPEYIVLEQVQAMRPYRKEGDYADKSSDKDGWGAASSFRFGKAVGAIECIVETVGIKHRMVVPLVWKKFFGLLKQDKEASRQLAIRTFKDSAIGRIERKSDHGRAEAALIALWGIRVGVQLAMWDDKETAA